MTTIEVFDPGETTGYCLATWNDDFSPLSSGALMAIVTTDEYTSYDDFWTWFNSLKQCADDSKPNTVVVEAFHLFPHMAMHQIQSHFPAAEKIGILKCFAFSLDIPVVMLQPSVKKGLEWRVLDVHRERYLLPTKEPVGEHMKDVCSLAVYYYEWTRSKYLRSRPPAPSGTYKRG